MGFPVGYSELLLPRVLLHIALILGYVRRLIFRGFEAVGLGDLLDADAPWPENIGHGHQFDHLRDHHHHHQQQQQQQQQGRPQSRSMSAMLIQEALPVTRYEELAAAGTGQHVGGSCVVCLYEFEAAEEVRPLSNCRHVFHRSCLDRWLEHEQRTCPLCRAPLIPEEREVVFDDQMWLQDSYYDDFFYLPLASPAPPSPTLLLPHQLFSSS
ncbi:E3 ubiquitin-protein ligase [Canna indica]|uniref:E3 ubiquitin-protein ligase n=1 Tax=Canna indica TaxID=4628 RepID=A0AAQ3QE80_9LILI|nr:E3 ubiquitin-protein ligase [Canna indica]